MDYEKLGNLIEISETKNGDPRKRAAITYNILIKKIIH